MEDNKACTRCLNVLPVSEFQVRKASKDGLTASCKKCLASYDKSRSRDPERIKARRAYALTEQGKAAGSKAKKKWVDKNPIKRNAHVLVGNAIRDGHLIKKPCEVCGSDVVNAHHCDYSKPLDVTWLCDKHHHEWHAENGEGKNAL
ncbi:endonuclease [Vibrio phage D85]|nr:hypothetical protein PODOV033v1_p0059 [Vibrio phage 252E42.2]